MSIFSTGLNVLIYVSHLQINYIFLEPISNSNFNHTLCFDRIRFEIAHGRLLLCCYEAMQHHAQVWPPLHNGGLGIVSAMSRSTRYLTVDLSCY